MKHLLPLLGLTLAGCTGLYLDLPSDDDTSDVDIEVTPITPALVAARAASVDAPAATPANASAVYLYRLGPGDILDVSIPSIANISTSAAPLASATREADRGYTVAPDGTIYLPYVGALKVQGSTIREVQDKVVTGLSRYIKVPQVTVSVTQFRSQKVLVAGQVPKPGYLPIADIPLTLVGALTAVGSTPVLRGDLAPRPLGSAVQTTAQVESGDYYRVRLTRKSEVRTYDVYGLLRSGDLSRDPLLQDGDVVYVPPVQRSFVFVLGEVRTPAMLEIVERTTSLAEVLLASGGVNQQTAKAERVYVIRGQLDKPQVFQLNANAPDAMLLADAFTVQPRDVVYVAEANISRWNRFLSQLVPTLQTLITGTVVDNALSN